MLSIKHKNKIWLPVGCKICFWHLEVNFLRVMCSLYGQCGLDVVAITF